MGNSRGSASNVLGGNMKNTDKTIQYYNKQALSFTQETVDVEFSALQNEFVSRIHEGGRILDLGCGSGRDSKAFIAKGFDVVSVDGSEEMTKIASEYIGQEVLCSTFQDYEPSGKFDGIWACASLLHLSKEDIVLVMRKLAGALNEGGSFYVSFKYGDFSGERNGRFFTDLTENSLNELILDIPDLRIQKQYITEDARPGRSDEKWLNGFLIKRSIDKNREVSTRETEIAPVEENEKIEGEIVFDPKGNKSLRIHEGITDIDFAGVVDRLAQYVNIAEIVSTIEKGVEYVVQIPAQYQKQYETGEYFINKNKTTGIEWPTLMRKTENGQYRFVDDLPIKQQELIQGNPFQDICDSFHNIYMQKQMAQLSERVEETYQTVKMIERGQQDDRIALIEAGRKEIMLALTLQDENDRNEQIRLGIHNLLLGLEQIGKAMVRRIEDFEPLPESRVVLFLNTLAHNNYQNKKDDEIENIQECYEMYLQATKMIAGAYAYKGEMAAVEQIFGDGISFLDSIDFGKLKSIELAHKGVDLDDMFYNHASQYVEIEKKQCVESGKSYDYVALEVTGDKLLEVLSDGGEVSKEKAK